MINQVRDDIIQHSPFKCIWVDTCEADDCIGTNVEKTNGYIKGLKILEPEPILIVSPDGDFKQLQKYPNVKQWSNIQKKWVKSDNPEEELFEKICKGDTGDGVPNVLSQDDVFVSGLRQRPLSKKKREIIKDPLVANDDEVDRNLSRNRSLIDLSYIPSKYKEQILQEFDNVVVDFNGLVTNLSVLRFYEIIDWVKENPVIDQLNWAMIDKPTHFRPNNLPEEIKQKLKELFS